MLVKAVEEKNLSIPLEAFDFDHPCERVYPQIQRSKYLGVNDVEATDCDHLAFVQPELDIRTIARMSHGAPTMMSEAGAAVLGMVGGMALAGCGKRGLKAPSAIAIALCRASTHANVTE